MGVNRPGTDKVDMVVVHLPAKAIRFQYSYIIIRYPLLPNSVGVDGPQAPYNANSTRGIHNAKD